MATTITTKSGNNTKISKILAKVSSRIKPDMSAVKDADNIVDKINTILKKKKIDAKCVKGGSIAKGTFLKDDYDIDLFVRFDKSYEDKDISSILERVISELCNSIKIKFERIHGSRDYYQFTIKKVEEKSNKEKIKELSFEIIPVMLVHASNQYEANNSTDLSPEHVNWVLKYTSKNPKLTEDIRLAKQFCKSNNVYGAESYINGFSGHIIDILVIHHGSFINLIKKFSSYNDFTNPIIIDTEKNLINPLKDLNKSKITPLIVVDPIQTYRNSAAAVSLDTLKKFVESCKAFLKSPNEKYFKIQTYNLNSEIKKSIIKAIKEKKLSEKKIIKLVIDINTLDGSKDVVGTKALKVYENIIRHLNYNDFEVLESGWNFEFDKRSAQIYILVNSDITKHYIQRGPKVSSKEDYKKFVDKHTPLKHKLIHKENSVSAIVPRKFTNPIDFFKDLIKQEFISNKVKGIKIRKA